jgi:hypothetical protein
MRKVVKMLTIDVADQIKCSEELKHVNSLEWNAMELAQTHRRCKTYQSAVGKGNCRGIRSTLKRDMQNGTER